MSKIADDSASIAQRLKELEADRKEAMTGSGAPVGVVIHTDDDLVIPNGWPYSPSGLNEAARQYAACRQAANQYNQPNSLSSLGNGSLSSLAHPGWPYTGTAFEWQRVVKT